MVHGVLGGKSTEPWEEKGFSAINSNSGDISCSMWVKKMVGENPWSCNPVNAVYLSSIHSWSDLKDMNVYECLHMRPVILFSMFWCGMHTQVKKD